LFVLKRLQKNEGWKVRSLKERLKKEKFFFNWSTVDFVKERNLNCVCVGVCVSEREREREKERERERERENKKLLLAF